MVSSENTGRSPDPDFHQPVSMDSSESLQIDEHLARLLAAYDQGMDGGDGKAPTIGVSSSEVPCPKAAEAEQPVKPLTGASPNEGSVGEVLPDSRRGHSSLNIRLSATTPPPPGGAHRVGRFELRRQLGKGGCGIVFLAYDPKLEREVALKIPRPEMLLSQDARRRLIREALAAAEFDHANLVPVYETGEIGPICFIATAFCPGQTLGEWLEKQAFPVPVRQAARLVATIAEAVQHAHDRGVLHRDLKPNNVILQAVKEEQQEQGAPPGSCPLRGELYIPRVVDFGLAKLLERGGPSETTTRQILGTPKYMAPEQAQARHEDVGPTVDVYALGVILYELLAGCAPYEGATDVEVLRQAIEGQFTNPRHIRPDIPRDLEAICLKAMDRSPAKRYRTAIDLADDLRRFLDGMPTLARPLKWPGRAVRWFRRNDQIVALIVVTLIATVLFVVGWGYMRQTQQLKDDQDRVAREQAERTQFDQHREYAKSLREAFLAWRAGNRKAASDGLEIAQRLASTGGETPDFALRYLALLIKNERTHLICPAGAVTALAVSRNGQKLATGHRDGSFAIWDRETGERLASIRAYDTEVTQIAFVLNDSALVTAGVSGTRAETAFLWNATPSGQTPTGAANGRAITTGVTCFFPLPDGRKVAFGTASGEIRIVCLGNGEPDYTARLGEGQAVTAIARNSEGKGFLVGTRDGKIFTYTNTLKQLGEASTRSGPVLSLLGGPNSSEYQSGSPAGLSRAGGMGWFRPTHSRVHWIVPLCNHAFAASEGPGQVIVWANGWRRLSTGDVGEVRTAAATTDGKTLFTAGDDGVVRSWQMPEDLATHATWSEIKALAIGVEPEGHRLAVRTPEALYDQFGSKQETIRPMNKAEFAAMRGLKAGSLLAVGFKDRQVVVEDLAAGGRAPGLEFRLPDGTAPVSADLSSNGDRIAVGDDRGRVTIWNLRSRARLATIDCGSGGRVSRVALSDDGRLVAAPSASGILIAAIEDSSIRITVAGDDQAVFRFVPDGRRLVSADRGGVVHIWSISDGREESSLYGHVGRVTTVAVSPDGRTILSGDVTGEIKFWDLRTGQELIGLRRHTGPVKVLEFAQNGKLLVSGSDTGVALWQARD